MVGAIAESKDFKEVMGIMLITLCTLTHSGYFESGGEEVEAQTILKSFLSS